MTPTRSPHKIAFDKALHAAWAESWLAYVKAGHDDVAETIEQAQGRASEAMEDAKVALAAACPGLEDFI